MKNKIVLSLSIFFFSLSSFAQYTYVVDTILNNGPKSNRINLVFLGDGYTTAQQTQFLTDVNNVLTPFFNTSPLKEYKNFFNVYAVRVISSQSGAKHPNNASDCSTAIPNVPVSNPNNLLGGTFDYGGTHRLLYCPNTAIISQILSTNSRKF